MPAATPRRFLPPVSEIAVSEFAAATNSTIVVPVPVDLLTAASRPPHAAPATERMVPASTRAVAADGVTEGPDLHPIDDPPGGQGERALRGTDPARMRDAQ